MSALEKRIAQFLTGHTGLSKFIPTKIYLKMVYKGYLGRSLSLRKPETFNEKIQWIKLNYQLPEITSMVDKQLAKGYVANIIGEEYIIPTIKVYGNIEDIRLEELPEQFVLKCTHDSGGLSICRDKNTFNLSEAKEKLKESLHENFYYKFREWAYKNISPCIIAEKYMESSQGESLRDYKFFCFNGEPELLYVSEGLENHQTAYISFFDLDGNKLPFYRSDYKPFMFDKIELPDNFGEMVDIARRLSKSIDVPFVRIDLYNIDGKIFFSEITFYPNAGLIPFMPDEWDLKLGNKINLKRK